MTTPKKPKAPRKALGKKLSTAPLHELIDQARAIKMTPAQKEAQRRSFAYGNLTIDNPAITREMVDAAASRLYDDPKKPKAPRKALGRKLSEQLISRQLISQLSNWGWTYETWPVTGAWHHRGYDQSGYAVFVWRD